MRKADARLIGAFVFNGALLAIGLVLARRDRTVLLGSRNRDALVTNPDDVAAVVVPELPDVVRRARKAGARGALEYLGAGMTSVVMCDARGRGWKVGRRVHPHLRSMLQEEADWFETANRVRAVRPHVAKFYRFHVGPIAIERECVRGRPGRWGDESKLHDLHRQIEKDMLPHGWTSPEFKEDSYIFRQIGKPDEYGDYKYGSPVLVDGSMAQRVGSKLIEYVEGVLDKTMKLREGDRLKDLAFYVRREKGDTIPAETADRLLARLPF